MKFSNTELLAKPTEATHSLDFRFSAVSNPIHPFFWELETQGELNIENLFKTATPDFNEYREGGQIMRNGNLQAYWQFVLSEAQKQSPEALQKYQTLINLMQSQLANLELLKIRTLHDPSDSFHVIAGTTASGEWVGICANILIDSDDDYQGIDCYEMGINNSEQIFNSKYQPQNEATANFVDRVQQISQDLEFFELEQSSFDTNKGWRVQGGATRATAIHNLLECIGFARTFPACKMLREEREQEDYERPYFVLEELLEQNLSNLRTYIFGIMSSYVLYIIGQTSSGDWAGVTSLAVWA
jgi:hypothetical protein